MKTLSERLIYAMDKAGIKQADLARATGAAPPSVHKWITGATKNLKGDHLVKVANLLGISTDWLANGHGAIETSWPFNNVTESQLKLLPKEAIQDIEAMILYQLEKHNK